MSERMLVGVGGVGCGGMDCSVCGVNVEWELWK